MSNVHEPPPSADRPGQEAHADRGFATWPHRRRDGYENPSLERYSDLRFAERGRRHRRWVIAIAGVLALGALLVAGLVVAIYAEARGDEARPVDALLVLGAAQFNGRPSEVFAARLQHTYDLYEQGMAPYIIVTGGRQAGDAYTEGETAEAWLLNRGVPQNAILVENEGRDTWSTMQGAWDVSRPYDIHTVLIVSDGFHLFRAERMANAVGFEGYTSPAPDSPIRPWSSTEFSYVVRETAAVIQQMPQWLW